MRPSPQRKPYDPAKYTPEFRDIIQQCHVIMSNHHGHQTLITSRGNTVECVYLFSPSGDGVSDPNDEEEVVLNLSHDKTHVYTIHHFGGAADQPHKYKTLKQEIDRLSISYSPKASKRINNSRPVGVNIFDEIRRALERLNCTNVHERDLRHAMKFTGNYGNIEFMFNVFHTAKDGNLQTKKKHNKIPETIVWDRPKTGPPVLSQELQKVVLWVKRGEAGELTDAEIAAGLNGGDNLVYGMAGLSIS
jgi:hypothetical protein